MNNPEKIKKILLSEIEDMNRHREDFCRRPGIDFTRERKIPFDTLLHFQISMESGCVSHELLKYFYCAEKVPGRPDQKAYVSCQAFQELCPPAKIPSACQLYIPILTDRTIVPQDRRFGTCFFVMQ